MKAYKRWPEEIKTKAKLLRRKGYSFGQLTKEFGVAKSTLSTWFKGFPNPDHLYFINRKQWLNLIRKKSNEVLRNKRNFEVEQIANRVKEEVASWGFLNNKAIQKSFLSLLYWAEGEKLPARGAQVRFANTDPRLALLFLTLLRNCYALDESKIRIALHLHWYHNVKQMRRFWSKLLSVNESRFLKPQLKRRSKVKRFRKNFAGICFVRYSSVDLRWEIMETGYNIQKRITG